MDLATVTVEDFLPFVGQEFGLVDTELSLVLLESKTALTRANAPRQAFTLLFRCPVPAPQGTYALRHQALGVLEIFLVPIAQDGAGVQLEAVFS